MVTKVCVLRSGGDFRPEHVQRLARMIPGLVCLSDVDVPGVECRPLRHAWPGWWSKLEAFGPAIRGDMLLVDLDTVVIEMPSMPAETTVLEDWTDPSVMNSSFLYVTEADRRRVWDAWLCDPAGHMKSCTKWPRWGDQGFLQEHIGSATKWGDEIRSYKAHCREGLPKGTKVVAFHGKPRPWDVKAAWMPQEPQRRDFRELVLAHRGARICVMGGAPTLALDIEQVQADIYISTNAHGIQWRRPDYLLAMDERHSRHNSAPMGQWLRERCAAPIISPHGFADFRLGMWPQNPRFVLSGMVAAWAAFAMGARVVILAGFDAYGGESGYIEEARKIARDVHCPVRVVGNGGLTKVWPRYDPKEVFMDSEPHSSIAGLMGDDGKVRVRARKTCSVGRVQLSPGEEMTAMRHEVARLLRHRMVEEVAAAEEPPPLEVDGQDASKQQLEDLSVEALKELATAKGLAFRANASKTKLIELLSAGG